MSARIELPGLALAMALVPAATWGAPERSGMRSAITYLFQESAKR